MSIINLILPYLERGLSVYEAADQLAEDSVSDPVLLPIDALTAADGGAVAYTLLSQNLSFGRLTVACKKIQRCPEGFLDPDPSTIRPGERLFFVRTGIIDEKLCSLSQPNHSLAHSIRAELSRLEKAETRKLRPIWTCPKDGTFFTMHKHGAEYSARYVDGTLEWGDLNRSLLSQFPHGVCWSEKKELS